MVLPSVSTLEPQLVHAQPPQNTRKLMFPTAASANNPSQLQKASPIGRRSLNSATQASPFKVPLRILFENLRKGG